jgi:hypothetical protein
LGSQPLMGAVAVLVGPQARGHVPRRRGLNGSPEWRDFPCSQDPRLTSPAGPAERFGWGLPNTLRLHMAHMQGTQKQGSQVSSYARLLQPPEAPLRHPVFLPLLLCPSWLSEGPRKGPSCTVLLDTSPQAQAEPPVPRGPSRAVNKPRS